MNINPFPAHCGSKIFYHLENTPTAYDTVSGFSPPLHKTAFAIYTNTPHRRKTYEKLREWYKILYQSPVLVNPFTENEYFIVIYLNEKP